ncbi:MAG: isochorismate synthase [Dehalococcoidia bacterium]|nr:isochorismate synthase [Dehalococcoidia bacterium]
MAVDHTTVALSFRIRERLREAGQDRFLGIRLPGAWDPISLLDDPAAHGVLASYERPDRGRALVAVGACELVPAPPGGLHAARPAVRRLLGHELATDAPELRPRLLAAAAFRSDHTPAAPWDGFGAGALLLPRLLFIRDRGVTGVVLAPGAGEGELQQLLAALERPPRRSTAARPLTVLSGVDRARWLTSVATIASEVRDGLYEKAVLATSIELGGEGPVDVGAALTRLRHDYPHCHLFSFTAGDATFLGASPELLVALDHGAVNALGLAGSARRGTTEAEDEQLGRELLESAKNRIEHETVVRAIREGLAELTSALRAPNQPRLRRLRNIQHLATEIAGRARPGVDVLDLVQRLHPTPAVCGWPTDAARRVIAAHETFDRGWYAGPIGWLDAAGEGEFAVGLRAALVRGERAWLFAGNGIMGDSDPAAELAEVELKFSPLAEALGAPPRGG